uniref:Uncharacterized protein n=1 Tax=Heterorhabditis bacteriophora TaxID=37862 RepID=A0A1I7WRX6_HETBA
MKSKYLLVNLPHMAAEGHFPRGNVAAIRRRRNTTIDLYIYIYIYIYIFFLHIQTGHYPSPPLALF